MRTDKRRVARHCIELGGVEVFHFRQKILQRRDATRVVRIPAHHALWFAATATRLCQTMGCGLARIDCAGSDAATGKNAEGIPHTRQQLQSGLARTACRDNMFAHNCRSAEQVEYPASSQAIGNATAVRIQGAAADRRTFLCPDNKIPSEQSRRCAHRKIAAPITAAMHAIDCRTHRSMECRFVVPAARAPAR